MFFIPSGGPPLSSLLFSAGGMGDENISPLYGLGFTGGLLIPVFIQGERLPQHAEPEGVAAADEGVTIGNVDHELLAANINGFTIRPRERVAALAAEGCPANISRAAQGQPVKGVALDAVDGTVLQVGDDEQVALDISALLVVLHGVAEVGFRTG